MSMIINNKKVVGTEQSVNPGDLGIFAGSDDNWYVKKSDGTSFPLVGFMEISSEKLVIPSASVLTLNSVPLTIVSAPGPGKAIDVFSFAMKMTFNSSAYATYTRLSLITDTAVDNQATLGTNILGSTFSIFRTVGKLQGNGDENIVENKDLTVWVETGDPTAGDSDITVYVSYRILEL